MIWNDDRKSSRMIPKFNEACALFLVRFAVSHQERPVRNTKLLGKRLIIILWLIFWDFLFGRFIINKFFIISKKISFKSLLVAEKFSVKVDTSKKQKSQCPVRNALFSQDFANMGGNQILILYSKKCFSRTWFMVKFQDFKLYQENSYWKSKFANVPSGTKFFAIYYFSDRLWCRLSKKSKFSINSCFEKKI